MADSDTRETQRQQRSATAAGKRERLVNAARHLAHEKGVDVMTLAQVAEMADVPLGNVYYYFKTRDDLIEAVVAAQVDEVTQLLERLDRRKTAAARLRGLAHNWAESADVAAMAGCPIGSLGSDLGRRHDDLATCGSVLLAPLVDWAEVQYRALGSRSPRDDAVALIAGVQGAALLANVFSSPDLLRRQVQRLERSISELGAGT